MKLKTLLSDYLNKKTDYLNTIRILSEIINPEQAVDLLVIINQITRHEQGDLETQLFKDLYEIE